MTNPLKVIKSIAVTDATLTATSVAESTYGAYSASTTYTLDDRVHLSHKVYQSLQSGNTGKDPLTETLWWVEVEATNRWKLFDLSSTTRTQIDASDYYEITPGQAINALALVNISGILTIRIRLTDPTFGVVHDTGALDIMPAPSESSWYTWFFELRTEQTQIVFNDIPSYPSATLRIDFTSSGAAYIGALVFGSQRTIGRGVNYGARLGIQDYSRKERNDWGDTVLVQRAYSKTINIDTVIDNSELDNTYTLLADLRSTPCLWVATDIYGSLSVFGFYTNFEIIISYFSQSDCSIELESLT